MTRCKKAALEATLDYYKINQGRDVFADALMRLDAIYGNGNKPSPSDDAATLFFQMHSYFVKQYTLLEV